MPEISIVVPTYNERGNIENLWEAVSNELKGFDFEMIFVDDNSPDGTARIIRELAARETCIKLIIRSGKLGLGSAILQGFQIARGDYLLMIDADLSHRPCDIRKMIECRREADIVIGSRYIKGGKIVDWPLQRRIISKVATALVKTFFNLPVRDPVSGFALYRKEIFQNLAGNLHPTGYKLLFEILAKSKGFKVIEIPITFINRANGKSKLNMDEILAFIKLCWKLKKFGEFKKDTTTQQSPLLQ